MCLFDIYSVVHELVLLAVDNLLLQVVLLMSLELVVEVVVAEEEVSVLLVCLIVVEVVSAAVVVALVFAFHYSPSAPIQAPVAVAAGRIYHHHQ